MAIRKYMKITHQGKKVCVAIFQTCAVSLVVLMRHGCCNVNIFYCFNISKKCFLPLIALTKQFDCFAYFFFTRFSRETQILIESLLVVQAFFFASPSSLSLFPVNSRRYALSVLCCTCIVIYVIVCFSSNNFFFGLFNNLSIFSYS